jgi:hypothetical protein
MILLKAYNSWGSGCSLDKTFTHIPSAVCSLRLIQQPSPRTLYSPIRPTCASVLSGHVDSLTVAAITHLASGFEALMNHNYIYKGSPQAVHSTPIPPLYLLKETHLFRISLYILNSLIYRPILPYEEGHRIQAFSRYPCFVQHYLPKFRTVLFQP